MRARYLGLAGLALLVVLAGCDRPTPVAPAEATLTITANPTRIGVNGESVVTVLARKSDGRAVNPGTEITFTTNLGAIDAVVATDDRGVAEATLIGDGRIGMASIAAESGAAMTATVDIQVGALASAISLSANKNDINKDLPRNGAKIKLDAVVVDDLETPIADINVRFTATTGTFNNGGSVKTDIDGLAENTLVVTQVPNTTDTPFEITATTSSGDGTEVSATIEITVSGFALNISLDTNPSSIPLTGGQVQLTATIRDDQGKKLEGAEVLFIKDAGSLSTVGLVSTDSEGLAFNTLNISAADLSALAPGTTGITVSAEVDGAGGVLIESDPRTINLQTDEPIAGFDFSVSGLTVSFTNTTTGDAPLTFEWDFGDGGTSTSENPGNTYAVDGVYQVRLTATNIGGTDTLIKDITVAPQPTISLSPTTLAFGSVMNPGAADRVLTISNAGLADLTVGGFSLSNPAYSIVSGLPAPLAPGATANVTVRFTPPVVAVSTSQNGTLTVISDDPDNPTAAVALTGTALP